jgi:hypothetical protein
LATIPWDQTFKELCQSKADEFKLVGYEHVSPEEVWACVSTPYAKTGLPAIHQIVNDILSLKATKFMNYMMMTIYRQDS